MIGSNSSTFTITNSTLVSKNVYTGASNSFGAIKVEDNNITINITGTLIRIDGNQNDQAIVSYETGALSGAAVNMGAGNNVTMTGDADFAHNNSDTAVLAISGGTFNVEVPEDCCAEGYICVKSGEKWIVKAGAFVAMVDTTKYETFEEAVAAAEGSKTIVLLADIEDAYTLLAGGILKVKLDGHTLTVNAGDGAQLLTEGPDADGVTTYYAAEIIPYTFDGAEKALSTILQEKGLTGTVTNGVSTYEALLKVEQNGEDWTLSAVKPFSSTEDVHVFAGEKAYVLRVTNTATKTVWTELVDRKAPATDYAVIDEDNKTVTVSDARGLAWVAYMTNISNENWLWFDGWTVQLGADIDLSGYLWEPIGNAATFDGSFDGCGHTVSNLRQNVYEQHPDYVGTASSVKSYYGLFGRFTGISVKNLVMDHVDVFCEGGNIGAVAGGAWRNVTFENITVKNSHLNGYNYGVGCIVGWATGSAGGDYVMTFSHITVDSSNVLNPVYNAADTPLGGILGNQGVPSNGSFKTSYDHCNISAHVMQLNDCTMAYDYWMYRDAGMLIGLISGVEPGAAGFDASRYLIIGDDVNVTYKGWNQGHYCEFCDLGIRGNHVRIDGPDYHSWAATYERDGHTIVIADMDKHYHREGEDHDIILVFDQLIGARTGGKGIRQIDGVDVTYYNTVNVDQYPIWGWTAEGAVAQFDAEGNIVLNATVTESNGKRTATVRYDKATYIFSIDLPVALLVDGDPFDPATTGEPFASFADAYAAAQQAENSDKVLVLLADDEGEAKYVFTAGMTQKVYMVDGVTKFNYTADEGLHVFITGPDIYGVSTYTVMIPVAKIEETLYATLADAIAAVPAGTETTITMIADETIDVSGYALTIPANKNVVLDLNGHQIIGQNSTETNSALICNLGTLTIQDGSQDKNGAIIVNPTSPWVYSDANPGGYASNLIRNEGTLVVNSGRLYNSGTGSACYAIDNYSAGKVTINGGTVDAAKSSAVRLFNNNGGKITVNNGNIGHYTNDSDSSYMGIQVQSGTNAVVEINGGTVDGQYSVFTNGTGKLTITGGTFPGYVGISASGPSAENISISGGMFDSWVGTWGDQTGFISGGLYAEEPDLEYCAEGLYPIANTDPETKDDYPYTVGAAVASITKNGTTTYYATLEAAIAGAVAGDTITILKDFTVDASKTTAADRIVVDKAVTIDFGEYTMTVPGSLEPTANWAALYIDADTTVTATTGGINCADNGSEPGVYAFNVRAGAKLTIDGGSYHGGGTIAQAQLGTIEVLGGTFTLTPFSAPYNSDFAFNCVDANYTAGTAKIEIKGGTFVGYDPQDNKAEGANTDFTAAGYVAIETATPGTFEVKEGGVITFVNYDDTELQTGRLAKGAMPAYTGEKPMKLATAEYTYTFAGWTPEVVAVTGEATYKATYTATKNSYTITWVNDDDSVIDTTTVEYGVVPTHADATKAATAEYTYTFAGWTPEVVAVTGEATYKATFTATKNSYTITWVNDDDSVIDTTTVEYGEVPTHADATKAATAEYTYSFAGWTPEVVAVTGAATYKATFTSSVNKYTVTFITGEGASQAPAAQEIEYGKKATKPEDPIKDGYSFDGWFAPDATAPFDFEETSIIADLVLTAQWSTIGELKVLDTLNLQADIGMYLYVYKLLTDNVSFTEGYTVYYSWQFENESERTTRSITLGESNLLFSGYYKIVLGSFHAKQMTETVDVVIKDTSGKEVFTDTYSIQKYCLRKISDQETKPALKNLCKATLDYGTYAQRFFNYKMNELANGGTDYFSLGAVDAKYAGVNGHIDGIKDLRTLDLSSQVQLIFYFKPDSGTIDINNGITVSCQDPSFAEWTLTKTLLSSGYYKVAIQGMPSGKLDRVFDVKVKYGGSTATWSWSAMSFAYYSQTHQNVDQQNVAKALAKYYEMASVYFPTN